MKRKAKESLSIFSIIVIFSLVIFMSMPLLFAYVPTVRFSTSFSQTLLSKCYLQHNGITLFSTDSNHKIDTLSVGQNKNFVVQPVAENKLSVKAEYQHYTKNSNNEIVFTVTNGDNAKKFYTIRLYTLNLYGVDISLPNEYITVTKTDSGNSTNISVKFDSGLGLENADLITFTFQFDSLFTQLEYIESNGTQYIDTGVNQTSKAAIDCKIYIEPSSNYPFGAQQNSSYMYNGFYNNSSIEYNWKIINFPPSNTIEMTQRVNGSTMNMVINGNSYSAPTGTSDNNRIYIFACTNNAGAFRPYRATMKCYYFKMYDDNGNLIRDFVPCKNASNVVGLFDLVEGKFYANAGTGDFIASDGISAEDSYSGTEIIFHSNGGTEIENGYYRVGDALPSSTKIGWGFCGWCLSETNNNGTGTSYNTFGSDLDGYTSMTLYAQWSKMVMLEYIESTRTQYIDTGVNQTSKAAIDCKIYMETSGGYAFGAQQNSSGMMYNGFYANYSIEYNWKIINFPSSNTIEMTQRVNGSTMNMVINGTSYSASTGTSDNNRIYIFACTRNSNAMRLFSSTMRCYYFKMYDDDGNLIRDFVPCKNTNNVVGLYDTVEGKFYTNAGTGDFNAGPVVS